MEKQKVNESNVLIDDSFKPLPVGSLNLKKEVIDLLKENEFQYFSDIQGKAIPKLLRHENVLGLSRTGTGKTLAYVLPIVNDLKDDDHVQAIVLSPTVALLDQIKSVFEMFLVPLGFPKDAVKIVKSNNDFTRCKPLVVLTTPSMYDTLRSHYPIDELERVIIDEGDMVAFDGFDDVLGALKDAKDKKMISFFSASLNIQDIKRVKKAFQIQNLVDVRESLITNKTVQHHLVNYRGMKLGEALLSFLRMNKELFKTIVFVSKKTDLFEYDKLLKENHISHFLVHGDMEKREITKVLTQFNDLGHGILLASDYVSRGIDIPDVTDIVSVDLPKELDYYYHRAGRAGRFDSEGDSFVFYDEDDEESVKKVRDLIRRGTQFDQYILSKDNLRKGKGVYQFKNKGKKDQSNELLQKQIRHVVNKTKTRKVKPGYKKKVAKAVERVKEKHRMKVVLTNIARSGGNTRDFHVEKSYGKKKKTK